MMLASRQYREARNYSDSTVNPRSAIEVASRIGARDRRLIWFERSGR